MKTSCELEKKLKKLPAFIEPNSIEEYGVYCLKISKTAENKHWFIEYTDKNDNSVLIVEHQSLQAAVDNALAALKQIN